MTKAKRIATLIIGSIYAVLGAKLIHNNLSSTQDKRFNELYETREIVYIDREYVCTESHEERYENSFENGERNKSKFTLCENNDSFLYGVIEISGGYTKGQTITVETATATLKKGSSELYSFDFVNTKLLSKDDFRDYVNEFIPKSIITTEIESEKKKYNIILIMIIAVLTFAVLYVRGDYEKFFADLNSVFAEDKIIEDACKKGKD